MVAIDRAMAVSGGDVMTAAVEPVDRPVDTTGASDLLLAAYVWADLRGAEPADRLRWAVLYASLAARTPTGIGGAVDESRLIEAGAADGLRPPPLARVGQV
jgi:sugar/nucleoside kinase (ribokinase family)